MPPGIKTIERKVILTHTVERSLSPAGLHYYHNFIQERKIRRVSLWKPCSADPSDTIGIVPPLCIRPLSSLPPCPPLPTYYLRARRAPERRQIILSESPPTRVSVGGSIFSIFAAYMMHLRMSINAHFYSRNLKESNTFRGS